MKYSELHRKIKKAGWTFERAEGSHYFYSKDGRNSGPVPFHGSKEVPEGLRKSILKALGIP